MREESMCIFQAEKKLFGKDWPASSNAGLDSKINHHEPKHHPCLQGPGVVQYSCPQTESQNPRIPESQHGRGWKGPLWVTQPNALPKRVTQSRLHSTASRRGWNISREGDSTTSLVSLFQCSFKPAEGPGRARTASLGFLGPRRKPEPSFAGLTEGRLLVSSDFPPASIPTAASLPSAEARLSRHHAHARGCHLAQRYQPGTSVTARSEMRCAV